VRVLASDSLLRFVGIGQRRGEKAMESARLRNLTRTSVSSCKWVSVSSRKPTDASGAPGIWEPAGGGDLGRIGGPAGLARVLCALVAVAVAVALLPAVPAHASGARPSRGVMASVRAARFHRRLAHARGIRSAYVRGVRSVDPRGVRSAYVRGVRSVDARGVRSAQARGIRPARARAAIVGGSEISVEQAPWQVAIFQAIPVEKGVEVELCGGVILGETRILTAGHCAVDPNTGAPATPEDMLVIAGVSDIEDEEATEQVAEVERVRVHPYFDYAAGPGTADDVAVLTLSKPLSLAGVAAHSIAMTQAGGEPGEGAAVRLTGFGEEEPVTEELTGRLNTLGMSVLYSRECGGEADALFVCASAPGGSACNGDSGSGLTTSGASPSVLGVADTVEVSSGQRCLDGAVAGFVNLAAPEVRDFVEGAEAPPQAPRGGKAVIRGVLTVGHSLTCEPGSWSNGPTFAFAFVESAVGGAVLQQGASPTYALSAADVGRRILCQVQATNAGGTGVGRTPALEPIKAAAAGQSPSSGPPPPASGVPVAVPPGPGGETSAPQQAAEPTGVGLLGDTLAVSAGGVGIASLDCVVREGCRGKLTLTAQETSKGKGARHKRTVTIGAASFSIQGDGDVAVRLALNAAGRALLKSGHGHLRADLEILQLEPAPAQSQSEEVRLVQQAGKARRHGSKGHRG
jgi:Trypsin